MNLRAIGGAPRNSHSWCYPTAACMGSGVNIHVAGTDFDICVPAGEESEATDTMTAHKEGRCVYFGDRNIAPRQTHEYFVLRFFAVFGVFSMKKWSVKQCF